MSSACPGRFVRVVSGRSFWSYSTYETLRHPQVFDGRSFALGGPASARFVRAPAVAGPQDGADGGAQANGHAPLTDGRADGRAMMGALRSDRRALLGACS